MRAQITARFGDSLVEVVEISREGSFRIGTAPGVDLAIARIGSFPIVSPGFVVRTPIGLGEGPSEQRLAVGEIATLRFDRVTITIELVERGAIVPLAKLDRRTVPFLVGSLIAHFVMWGIAVVFAHAPKPSKPRPKTVLHPVLARIMPTPPRHEPAPSATTVTRTSSSSSEPPRGHPSAREAMIAAAMVPSTDGEFSGAYRAYLHQVDKEIKDALDHAGPLYVEEDAPGFAKHGHAFDPTHREGWGTIATGRYKTISSGRGVGDEYHLAGESMPELALCESPHCAIAGALDKTTVQEVIAPQVAALANCVGQDSLTLALEIETNGHVKSVHGHGKIARCAANVIGQLAFPEADGPTKATYTIGYP